MVKVILNEQHQLLINQDEILTEKYGEGKWKILPVPASGWTLAEMEAVTESLKSETVCETVCFASPIPALMKLVASGGIEFFVLHNDRREKKELPGGKIIMTVAQEGWVIV